MDRSERDWLLELMDDHDFTIPSCAFDELVEALSYKSAPPPPAEQASGEHRDVLIVMRAGKPMLTPREQNALDFAIAALSQRSVVDEAMVERAAEAMWNAAPGGHPMLKKLGHPTDWQSQVTATKLGYRRQTRAALTATLAGQQR